MQKSPNATSNRQQPNPPSAAQRIVLLTATSLVIGAMFITACGVDIGVDNRGNITIGPADNDDGDFFDDLGDGLNSLFDDDDDGNFFDDLF